MTTLTQYKGKYSKSTINQKLFIHDPPTTSAQDIICSRTNDTSSDISYPNSRYISTKNLGDGSASLIFEGYDNQENKKVIIKKISKKEYWRKELEVLQKLADNKSGKILKYLDFFESHRCSYIITEFYGTSDGIGFDLFEHIDLNVPYTSRKAILLILEMAKCIKECHDNNILHLDIKCENYMVKSNNLFDNDNDIPNIVLIDFGHAEIIPKNESIEKLRKGYNYGTTYYTCPEGHFEKIYSSKSDIWSLAICLCLFLTEDYPYSGRKNDYYRNSVDDNFSFTKKICPELSDLLTESLSSIPSKRPSIDVFIRKLTSLIRI